MNKLIVVLCFSSLLWINCESNGEKKGTEKEIVTANSAAEHPTLQPMTSTRLMVDSAITLDYIMGKFEPTEHKDFIQVPSKYANGRKDRWLRKETYTAFLEMYAAAKTAGIELKVLSATRNFAMQKIIWEGKWTGTRLHESKENLAKTTTDPTERALKILKWSSMPGTSRHHWGTDMDLNAFTNDFFEKGKGLKMYTWMTENASKFGFCQPYSPKDQNRPNGYNEEKWHWSYLPLAQKLTEQAELRLENEMINGFKGAETAGSIGVVNHFILGINGACL